MTRQSSNFRRIDDLVLQLKGLVLVRELLSKRGASLEELDEHAAEIDRVRTQLAALVQSG